MTAHIGWYSVFFGSLTSHGKMQIVCLDPDPRYTQCLNLNMVDTTALSEVGFSARDFWAALFIAPFWGFCLSCESHFATRRFKENCGRTFRKTKTSIANKQVWMTTLDSFCSERNWWRDVIKIDVGALEIEGLLGGQRCLESAKELLLKILDPARVAWITDYLASPCFKKVSIKSSFPQDYLYV